MKIAATAKHVTVFINSTDHWQHQPLYSAIVQLCREKRVAGVSVTRCIEGYGAGRQLHTERIEALAENLPVRIDIVDQPEFIEPVLKALENMIGEGLVTVADVQVLRFLPDAPPS